MIDTHSHIDLQEFKDDIQDVIKRAKDNGITKIFLPNVNIDSINPILQLCYKYKGFLYPMMGLHPEDVNPENCDIDKTLEFMEETLLKQAKSDIPFIAVGEVGLDYYWDDQYKEMQRKVFIKQIVWAKKFKLPLMIHTRKAFDDMIDIMQEFYDDNLFGVFHCFSEDENTARQLLKFNNFCLGIGGILTFKKSKLPTVIKNVVPLERIVLETDAPYMAPAPFRGQRNEPAFVRLVALKLAEINDKDICFVEQITDNNAMRIFKFQ